MRICFLSRRYFPAVSGMSVYAQNYLRELVRLGHDVVMISQYRGDRVGTSVYGGGPPPDVPGVRVIGARAFGEEQVNEDLPADFEADIQTMVDIALEAHREKAFDIVHAQYGYPTGLAALEISWLTGIANVISIQGGDGHWVGLCCETHRLAIRAVFNHANELIIGSRSFAEEVHENHKIPLERFCIIPGAINAERFQPRPSRRIGATSDPPVLLYHGRVDRRKGVLELIEAADLLRRRNIGFQLIISGIGPDLEAARALSAARSLDDTIEFNHYVDYAAVPDVYRSADIFVSPTWSEGFSNTILEAMASGLPIVASRSVGVVDCLTDGESALLHELHDVEGLAVHIRRLLDDGPLRQRLAENALVEVQQKYQWPIVARQVVERLESIRKEGPDNRWVELYDRLQTVGQADMSCRFRTMPHLL